MTGTRLHATTVAIGGRAVLLMGKSGSGKSDLAIRLIDRGAALVSDDYTVLTPVGDALLAAPPLTISGQMEVRGLGIIAAPYVSDVPAALVIRLGEPVERMPPNDAAMTIAGFVLPVVNLDAFEGSAAIKVELALHRVTEGT